MLRGNHPARRRPIRQSFPPMKTNCLIIPLGAMLLCCLPASLLAENPQFRERLAAWQSPQGSRSGRPANFEEGDAVAPPSRYAQDSIQSWTGGGESDEFVEGGYGGCNHCSPNWDWCGNGCGPRLWWIRKEGLLFWRKGRDLPPLVTSSTDPVPPPGTTVLFGGDTQTSSAKIGGRLDFGTWLTCDEFVGLGGRIWGLENDRNTFALSSANFTDQTIERPFIDAAGAPNSLVIADPFSGFGGNVRVATSSAVFGGDIYARIRCYQSFCSRTDFVTGYQFTRINESLQIHSNSQDGSLIVDDNYATRNEFHGAILGMLHDTNRGCLNIQLLARVALGNMRETAIATGQTNGQAGGLLVEANTTQVRDKFAVAPEFGVTLGYRISPCTHVTAGYTFLYWSNVSRPEQIIDNVRGDNVSLVLRDSGFWVQGFTAGLTSTW